MPLLPLLPELVPFEEVATVLEEAARNARGGPMAVVSGRMLAMALDQAGLRVVRDAAGAQLSL